MTIALPFCRMIWVTAARPLPNYCLWVRFSDATEGELDLREFVDKDPRAIVQALRDPAQFSNLRVELDTVVWGNGFDLAPEFLYERASRRAGVSL